MEGKADAHALAVATKESSCPTQKGPSTSTEQEGKAVAHALTVATIEPPYPAHKRKASSEEQQLKKKRKEGEKKRKMAEMAAADEVGRQWLMRFNQKECSRYEIQPFTYNKGKYRYQFITMHVCI